MKISKTHQTLSEVMDDIRVLTEPENYLGTNWKEVLNFWIFLDTMNEEQWNSINVAYSSLSWDERDASFLEILNLARDLRGVRSAWLAASRYYLAASSCRGASGFATYELINSHKRKKQGKSLVYFPLFLNI
jgi:hypothetical protein